MIAGFDKEFISDSYALSLNFWDDFYLVSIG